MAVLLTPDLPTADYWTGAAAGAVEGFGKGQRGNMLERYFQGAKHLNGIAIIGAQVNTGIRKHYP